MSVNSVWGTNSYYTSPVLGNRASSVRVNDTVSEVRKALNESKKQAVKYLENPHSMEEMLSHDSEVLEFFRKHGIKFEVSPENINDGFKPVTSAVQGKNSLTKHVESVGDLAVLIGEKMGLSKQELIDLGTAGYYHDNGKPFIPSNVLNKTGKPTDTEKAIIDLHEKIGEMFAKKAGLNDRVVELIGTHHTYGTVDKIAGHATYHYGKGKNPSAEILKIADVFDALTAKRCYKSSRTPEEAIAIMRKEACKDGKYSPEIVEVLVKALEDLKKLGTEIAPSCKYFKTAGKSSSVAWSQRIVLPSEKIASGLKNSQAAASAYKTLSQNIEKAAKSGLNALSKAV